MQHLGNQRPPDHYAVTLGMNRKPAKRLKVDWKPMQKLNVRPNIRYDRADGIGVAFRPFAGKKDQFLFSLDATLPFEAYIYDAIWPRRVG